MLIFIYVIHKSCEIRIYCTLCIVLLFYDSLFLFDLVHLKFLQNFRILGNMVRMFMTIVLAMVRSRMAVAEIRVMLIYCFLSLY